MFVRENWIKNTKFHSVTDAEVLALVLKNSKAVLQQGKLPIVIFDLDSTLFNVSKRSYEIIQEWLVHAETKTFVETREKLKTVTIDDFKYSLEDVWSAVGIPYDQPPFDHHLKHAKQFWKKRFFGNHYVQHDEPTPGAIDYVNELYKMGVYIVYLTGRDAPLMAFGTFDQLKSHGLPIEVERTRLILKPKRHLDDLEFKAAAVKTVCEWGQVVASFENEPKNLVAIGKVLPETAMNIFIETVSSDHPAPAAANVYRIKEFHF